MHLKSLVVVLALVGTLSGCLENDLERGAAGAAGGAVIAGATGGNVVGGAIIGGAAGILCDDLNICPESH